MRFLVLLLSMAAALAAAATPPVPVIFDTDMGNDIDDAMALAILHNLEKRGEIKLLAVTLTKDNPWASAYTELINRFYNRPDIPLGVVSNGVTKDEGRFARKVAEAHGLKPRQHPEAVALLRKTLAAQADGSVILIQVGFSTNLARLLATTPDDASPLDGRALAAKKVKLLSVMGGNFVKGDFLEYNIKEDVPSAQKLAAGWPTPIVFSGFEIGEAITYPYKSIAEDYRWTAKHPVVEGYVLYEKMPHNRPTWDLTSVLYALRPDRAYFDLSTAGTVSFDAKGKTAFTPSATGRHRYLKVNPTQVERIRETFVWLCSEPPK
ncbi:MAG: nucleoside hydrolase [Bryobacteraceae bacterium]|nr:nucleoside hydrolase [Bryobacteraceae bacterium]